MFLILGHQNLAIYNISRRFIKECYKITACFPPDERFGMISQIKRAAVSFHLNLAEGCSRKSEIERKRFYEIVRGSLVEIDAVFDIAHDLGYLDNINMSAVGQALIELFKLVTRFIKAKTIE